MNLLAKRAIRIHERLLEFYGEPVCRNPLPAIDELVSTILSQNTNDINRDRAFHSLRARFGTWEEVRDALSCPAGSRRFPLRSAALPLSVSATCSLMQSLII